jgi:rubrerythrin
VAGKGRKRRRERPWQSAAGPAPPSPAEQRARECGGKVAHDNEVAAEQAALEHAARFGESKAVYRCRWCGRWHVGSPG